MAEDTHKGLVARIGQAVRRIEPCADVILYGSRARGDPGPVSDWDVLILVDGEVSTDRADQIRHQLYEVEWETGEVISSVVRTRAEWGSDVWKAMPFHQRVDLEGIKL